MVVKTQGTPKETFVAIAAASFRFEGTIRVRQRQTNHLRGELNAPTTSLHRELDVAENASLGKEQPPPSPKGDRINWRTMWCVGNHMHAWLLWHWVWHGFCNWVWHWVWHRAGSKEAYKPGAEVYKFCEYCGQACNNDR